MRMIPDISYCSEAGDRGCGDLYLPERVSTDTPVALTIHGGGWASMDRTSFAGVAEFLCGLGFAAFNINYRLLDRGPWPLCGDDCLRAADCVLNGTFPELDGCDRRRLFIIGASAGGHLALMTGLRLPEEKVSGIVSLSGVDDMDFYPPPGAEEFRLRFFGGKPTAAQADAANPVKLVRASQPPVLCTHTVYDTVVSCDAAESFVARCREAGARIDYFRYDRSGDGHCLWIPGSSPHRLLPELENAVAGFAAACGLAGERK